MASSSTVDAESTNLASRYTKDGRKVSYRLNVIQQPERARACGQGAKSSSDRRPVDPPPIVELRVFEGEENRDITFPYNAGFFLFATLEPARAIAQGRAPQTPANHPVLTGTPVAGISYLDRPQPAGYFIFPDLSVRHEGQYRLSFTLFEELKEPRDADVDTSTPPEQVPAVVHRRCEVKSLPFHVYSAKKFPGLTESTLLSRVVADQGCRVRIRRDVRMRRRDSKQEKDWDQPEDEPPASAGAMPSTTYDTKSMPSPEQPSEHNEKPESVPSSTSTATLQGPPSAQPVSHHQPTTSYGYQAWYQNNTQAQQQPSQPMYSPQAPSEQSYSPTYPPSYQQQHFQASQHQNIGQYPQYAPQYGYQQGTQSPMVQSPTYGYNPQQQMQQMYQPQQDMSQMSTVRQQQQSTQQHPSHPSTYGGVYSNHDRDLQNNMQYPNHQQVMYQQQQQPMNPNTTQQPPSNVPLAIGKPLPPMEVPRVSHTTAESLVSPLNATAAGRQPGALGPPTMSRAPPPQFLSQTSTGVGSKRSYGSTFNTQHTEESMRNGARPNAENLHDWPDPSDEDLEDLESIKMTYRRADGTCTVVTPRRFGVS